MTEQGKSAYLSFDPIGLCSCRAQTNKVIKKQDSGADLHGFASWFQSSDTVGLRRNVRLP